MLEGESASVNAGRGSLSNVLHSHSTPRYEAMRQMICALLLSAMMALAVSTAALAAGTGGSQTNSRDVAEKLERAEMLINNGNPRDAVPILQKVIKADNDNADAYNYLGFAYRHLGEYDKSKQYYDRALEIDGNHRGAREYLGELYLKMDNLPEAQEQLAKLDGICSGGCSEYDELKEAIDDYQQSHQ